MQYYYQSHIRNLEQQALVERQKKSAELFENKVFNDKESRLKSSRINQDRSTAAYLERSRLEAELSAHRVKAESSMNRSRLEAAFELRKHNQIAFEKMSELELSHQKLILNAEREETAAKKSFEISEMEAKLKIQEERRLGLQYGVYLQKQREAIMWRKRYYPYY